MAQEVVIPPTDIVSADLIIVNLGATSTLLICTGTAVFDFEGADDGITRGAVQFFIPKEIDTVGGAPGTNPINNPLDVSRLLRPGGTIHEATVASLASFTGDTGPWAVDGVEVFLVPGGGSAKFLQLTAGLAVGKGSHILRMAYQANILFFVQ
jgi:hypothetical protein